MKKFEKPRLLKPILKPIYNIHLIHEFIAKAFRVSQV